MSIREVYETPDGMQFTTSVAANLWDAWLDLQGLGGICTVSAVKLRVRLNILIVLKPYRYSQFSSGKSSGGSTVEKLLNEDLLEQLEIGLLSSTYGDRNGLTYKTMHEEVLSRMNGKCAHVEEVEP